MRKICLLLILMASVAGAQTRELDYTQAETEFETGARLDAGLEIGLIPKRLDLTINEEVRFRENFTHFHRSYTSADLEYSILDWLKADAEYSFILNNSSTKGWSIRHRGAFSLTEKLEVDRWEFSLREKLQMTHRTDSVNLYQSPKNELSLKTRLKVAYDLPGSPFKPYVSAEARFLLNGVRPGKFVFNEQTGRWGNPDPEYSDVYFNRVRIHAGTGYKASRKSELDFYIVADLCYDLDVDFNSKGYQKKDETSDTGYADYLFMKDSYFVGVGISYKFKL